MAERVVEGYFRFMRPIALSRLVSRGIYCGVVLALLTILAPELFLSVRQESQVFDEAAHLYAGFAYWKRADFGRNPEHPPLAKLVAAVPLLPLHLKEPGTSPVPFFKAQDFIGGSEFLYSGDADATLLRGRMAVAVFTVALALLVLAAAHEMFGPPTALLALGLLVFEPVMLANGALVTTDMALTCLFFGSVYAFYRYVKQPSLIRLAMCTAATAGTLASKHSGALILPALALLAGLEVFGGRWGLCGTAREIPIRLPSFHSESFRAGSRPAGENAGLRDDAPREVNRARPIWTLAAAWLAIVVVSYVGVWTVYGFRYAARPAGLQMAPSLAAYSAGLRNSAERDVVGFFARHRLFPESYLYGWIDVLQIPGTRPAFLLGKIYSTGKWFFFPVVILIKSTLTLLILLALAPFAGLWKQRRELLFLAAPALFFLFISIFSGLNIGVRHILPVYPFFIILAAAAGWRIAARSRPGAIGVAALLVFTVASSLNAFPDYLAYSNEAFGGPSRTYRVVTDANADWGQGLKWVKSYIDTHQITDCWFDYSNPFVNPEYYGIRCKPLLSALGRYEATAAIPPSISGTVFISATEAEGLFWGPEGLNPYDPFKKRQPDAIIGNVVLAYTGTFDVPLLAAHSHSALALALLGQRKIPEAMAEAQMAVLQAPESAEINAVVAEVLMAADRRLEAQQAFGNALRLARAIHPDYQASLIRQLEKVGR